MWRLRDTDLDYCPIKETNTYPGGYREQRGFSLFAGI
jgi:hypothetical protein